jgi:plastocyanin domain-containing protein
MTALVLTSILVVVCSLAGCGQVPAAVHVQIDQDGVQALTLVVTRETYSPASFSVKKGVPVKITFREVGSLTCGNDIVFPSDPAHPITVKLTSPDDQQVVTFAPTEEGTFQFHCPCNCLEHTGSFTVVP